VKKKKKKIITGRTNHILEGKKLRTVCLLQGIYYFITGVWPLLHIESFIWISGPKYDIWLVKTVGIVLAVIGISLCSAAINKRIMFETFFLAAGSAASLAVVDIYYAAVIDRIYDLYLLDALAEIILLLLWLIFIRPKKRENSVS
jgi:energy-converting hydrogenase Eha subunit C